MRFLYNNCTVLARQRVDCRCCGRRRFDSFLSACVSSTTTAQSSPGSGLIVVVVEEDGSFQFTVVLSVVLLFPSSTEDTMDDVATTPPASNKRLTKRKIKAFPSELANVTDEDRSRFGLALEVDPNPKSKHYGSECLVAHTVRVKNVDNEDITVDLKTLVVDHLRQLCKNVGVMNCGNANKFECRKGLATFISYQDELDRRGISATSTAARLTSSLCRGVNVVFSEHFVKDFFSVNDKHSRCDHETKKTSKSFWINATLAHNSCLDSELDIVNILNAGGAATATEENATATTTNDLSNNLVGAR